MKLVLVVDDEPTIRQLVADALSEAGYRAETAVNGAEALRMMSERRPDAIVLDLMMPVLDATGFLHLVKLNARLASIPVVVISAAYGALDEAARLGAQACLTKPFELDQLTDAVAKLIGPGEPLTTLEPPSTPAERTNSLA